ncbi:MAG: hypothetical protein ACHQ1G_09815 [Planctomycetota bacterium]
MRGAALGALAALVLGACGDTVAERIDAVQGNGRRYVHGEGEVRFEDPPAARSLARQLSEDPDGKALLDRSQSAVPELILLLDDPGRRSLAAVFLAEIGGDKAVAELLARWRGLRGDAKEKTVYRSVGSGSFKLGYRYEGVGDGFYGELIMALAYAGRPVSAEIAKDTEAAIAESERLEATGADPMFREERDEDGRRLELRWWAEPIETACEGLRILAMLDAPEAPSLFAKALRSPVRPLRWTAVQEVLFLGDASEQLLPALGPLLDDPELRADAAEQVTFLLDHGATAEAVPVHHMSGDQQAALAVRCKERLKALGHLR